MPSEWAEVETLMRDLGAVRVAAFAARASDAAYVAVEQAIADATQAVVETLDDPRNAKAISQARQAIDTARKLVGNLAVEIDRSQRARQRAAELRLKPRRRDGEAD